MQADRQLSGPVLAKPADSRGSRWVEIDDDRAGCRRSRCMATRRESLQVPLKTQEPETRPHPLVRDATPTCRGQASRAVCLPRAGLFLAHSSDSDPVVRVAGMSRAGSRRPRPRARSRLCGCLPCLESSRSSRTCAGPLCLDDGRARVRVPTKSAASRAVPRVERACRAVGSSTCLRGGSGPVCDARAPRYPDRRRQADHVSPGLAARCGARRLNGVQLPAHRARGARPIRWPRR